MSAPRSLPTRPQGPRLDRAEPSARLLVDGQPFLVRGIELHNSTASSPDHLESAIATAVRVNANTVLAPVSWETVEPQEGVFDFASVGRLLEAARTQGVRLVPLWFGAWKNGSSSYAPGWVKRDPHRFPRCVTADGDLTDTLTPFGATDLDRRAFVEFMRFVEVADSAHRTVLMVQIENEIGLLGDSRDHSSAARSAFDAPVPGELSGALAQRPDFARAPDSSWSSVDQDPLGRDEAFMAWGYARHVESLASSAREHTQIPFFVNAWLDSELDLDIPGFTVAGGQQPGTYPSGGPLPRVADVWTVTAPTVDLFTPDVYFGDPDAICTSFSAMSHGLFIPEQRAGADGVGNAFLAMGEYSAIGVAPFGVDSLTEEELEPLTDGYRILRTVEPCLTAPDGSRVPAHGFHLTDERPTGTLRFADLDVEVTRSAGVLVDDSGLHAYGLVLALTADTYLIAGRGFHAAFTAHDPHARVGLDAVHELAADDAAQHARRLNGDETGGGARVIHPPLHRRPSPFPIPASHSHSGLSVASTYRIPRRAGAGDAV